MIHETYTNNFQYQQSKYGENLSVTQLKYYGNNSSKLIKQIQCKLSIILLKTKMIATSLLV